MTKPCSIKMRAKGWGVCWLGYVCYQTGVTTLLPSEKSKTKTSRLFTISSCPCMNSLNFFVVIWMSYCCFRIYSYLAYFFLFGLHPPFSFNSYFSLWLFAFDNLSPLKFSITLLGVCLDILWNHKIFNFLSLLVLAVQLRVKKRWQKMKAHMVTSWSSVRNKNIVEKNK